MEAFAHTLTRTPQASLFASKPASATRRSQPLRVSISSYQVTFVTDTGASQTVECPGSDFLLDAAESAGVPLPCSCRGGLCGSCVSKLHDGRVDMDWWADGMEIPLTVEQMQAGYILPCCAKPLSDCRVEYNFGWGLQLIESWPPTDSE